ncbi:hypothetical protein SFOMI_0837 [Sphingobium fuliginis]|uniref:Uncharacterized protein n=1 Tax=Sphingobium fuliginis (strain ATCC 27551) TaxID=336203 RepID=A0A292ZBT9_SPHSA|nr:hypothetical protein SFOMI_0837 [Sphingobium fuliginis]
MQKWEPVLRLKGCDNKSLERAACIRFSAARSGSDRFRPGLAEPERSSWVGNWPSRAAFSNPTPS